MLYSLLMSEWQVQEAKAELSTVIKAAQRTPQIITRHGEPVAVIVSFAQFQDLRRREGRQPLFSFLRTWPEFEIPERDKADYGRDIEL
jgi:prevent-host-death family protein